MDHESDVLVAEADLVRRGFARAVDLGLCAGFVGLAVAAGADTTSWGVTAALLAVILGYDVVMVTVWGATIGKLIFGLRVFRFPGGDRVPLFYALGRVAIFAVIQTVPCGIGTVLLLVSAINDESGWHRGWHDRAAGTVVVKIVRA